MKFSHTRAISLTELAIVVAVIALLIAAIVGGAQLLETAKLRRIGADFDTYRTAMSNFRDTYGYLPGDFPNASSVWTGESNGDGNTTIDYAITTAGTPKEDLLLWRHLQLAKSISGSFTGTNTSANARYTADSNAPSSSAYSEAVFGIYTSTGTATIYSTNGILMRLGSIVDVTGTQKQYPFGGFLTPKQAYGVDAKFDDGIADKGFIYGIRGDGASACTNNAYTGTSGTYTLTSTARDCGMVEWYQKF